MNSRWFLRRPRSSPTVGRIDSARIAMGGVAHKPWRLKAAESALRGYRLTTPMRLGRRSRRRSPKLARSHKTRSKSNLRSESHCGRSKLREHVYERHWTTNLPNRWAPQSDWRSALYGRYSYRGRRLMALSSRARLRTAGRSRSTQPRRNRLPECWRSLRIAICHA